MIIKNKGTTKKIKVLQNEENNIEISEHIEITNILNNANNLKFLNYNSFFKNKKNLFLDEDKEVRGAFIELIDKYKDYIDYDKIIPVIFYKDSEQIPLSNIFGEKQWNLSSYTFYFFDGDYAYCVVSQFNSICFLEKRIHALDAIAATTQLKGSDTINDQESAVVKALEGQALIEDMTKLIDWTVDNTDELLDHMYSSTGFYTDINSIDLDDDSDENIKKIEKAILVTPHDVMNPKNIESYVAKLADITRRAMINGGVCQNTKFFDDIPEFILEFFELVLDEQVNNYRFFLDSNNAKEVAEKQKVWMLDYSLIDNAQELLINLSNSSLILKSIKL